MAEPANPTPPEATTPAAPEPQATPAPAAPPAAPPAAEPEAPAADVEELRGRDDTPEALVSTLAEIAKAGKVPTKVAQQMLDAALKSHDESVLAQQQSWREAAINDPTIGGDRLNETTTRANQFVEAFGSPALREILAKTKLNEHPEFLRLFAEAHKAVSPDRLAVGRPAGTRSSRDMSFSAIAERMYKKS